MKYKWAWELYLKGVNNNWVPQEVNMQKDVELWKKDGGLSEAERRLIMWNMGFFSTAESLTANNIVLVIYRHLTNPECRQYLLRQAYEEAVHTHMFIYCCDTLGIDSKEVFNAYEQIPSIKEKDDFVVSLTKNIMDPNFTTEGDENIRKFLLDIISFYLVMEGIFFYAGFAMMLSLLKQNKMVGIGEQFQYTLRDESLHIEFGVNVINTIIKENPSVFNDKFKEQVFEIISKAVELEHKYIDDCLPHGILGLNQQSLKDYIEYIADRRLSQIHLGKIYNKKNPFQWMNEIIDVRKEKNFFETRVTEYQVASPSWD